MKKVAMMVSNIPDPRILKRIKVLESMYFISLCFWDRGLKERHEFEVSSKVEVNSIKVKAPQGRPLARLIPLIKFAVISLAKLRTFKPHVIHALGFDMLIISSLYKLLIDKNIKIVYEVADLPKYTFVKKANSIPTFIARMLQRIEGLLTDNISLLILTSPYFWEEYYSKFVAKSKYMFLPNAPYKSLFENYKKLDKDTFTIGFIGLIRYVEQLKMLIDVAGELSDKIKVFIAGVGPGYSEIESYSKNKSYVEIYGPYNYEKEIVSLYEKVDCVYSVYDTSLENVKIALPNRLYESIVCELPIIVAKNTMLGKFVEENEIGITVSDTDKEELKKALIELINSKELLIKFRKNCNRIKSNYYFEKNINKLIEAYLNML